jgi:hypothetical protein
MPIPVKIDTDRALASIGGEPHVFHCHHYNCFLQKSVLDHAGLVDAEALLVRPAAEVVAAELSALSADRAMAEELFSTLGFGKLDLSALSAVGGKAQVKGSHYGQGWISKFGHADRPVCHFNAGFVEAAARHLFGAAFTARETRCLGKGDRSCEYEVVTGGKPLGASPGMGKQTAFPPRPAGATKTSINEAAIVQACGGLPLGGDAEGNVHAFGVSLTRQYANYYNLLSYRFDRAMSEAAGEAAAEAARLLLVEAGRICAFHTFGGIMESAEWEALIKPQCRTREDWVYGMVAVVNALGWGRWSVAEVTGGSRLELVVDGSYESNGYLAAFGTSTVPRCHLVTGGAAGLMNLVYNADITARPELTPDFYVKTFQSAGVFVSREVECRTMGAAACKVVVERL